MGTREDRVGVGGIFRWRWQKREWTWDAVTPIEPAAWAKPRSEKNDEDNGGDFIEIDDASRYLGRENETNYQRRTHDDEGEYRSRA